MLRGSPTRAEILARIITVEEGGGECWSERLGIRAVGFHSFSFLELGFDYLRVRSPYFLYLSNGSIFRHVVCGWGEGGDYVDNMLSLSFSLS